MGSDGDTKGTAVTEGRAVRAELVEAGEGQVLQVLPRQYKTLASALWETESH